MTRAAWVAAAVLLAGDVAGARAVQAQTTSGTCTVSPSLSGSNSDVCEKGRDLFSFLMPQVGVVVSSGNPVLGEGGTLGGWGRRALSIRLTAVEGYLPENDVPLSVSGTPVSSDFGAARTAIPLPAADVAIGLFAGVPMGLTNVGGVDILAGASYLPRVRESELQIEPEGSGLALSYGARVGLLQESSFIPGVSVSYMRRQLPTTDIAYTPGDESLRLNGTSVTSNSLRVVAGKRFTLIGVGGGVGRDQIESTGSMLATVDGPLAQTFTVTLPDLRQKITRNTAFANVSFALPIVRIVAEYGWSSAGTIRETVNRFGDRRANEGYRYGSIGISTRF